MAPTRISPFTEEEKQERFNRPNADSTSAEEDKQEGYAASRKVKRRVAATKVTSRETCEGGKSRSAGDIGVLPTPTSQDTHGIHSLTTNRGGQSRR